MTTIKKMAYSGATAEHLQHYIDIALQDHPKIVIIHGGTNDVYGRNRNNKTAEEVVQDLIKSANKCRDHGVTHVFVSSLLPIFHTQAHNKVKEINVLLKSYCEHYNFGYIDNDFLTIMDLKEGDPVHLSWDGRCKLVNNYIHNLKKY